MKQPTSLRDTDFHQRVIHVTSGVNHIAFDPTKGAIASSDAYMGVSIERGGVKTFETNFSSMDDRIRSTQRIRGLQFSDDGTSLYVAAGEKLHAIDLATGAEQWSYRAPRSWGFLIVSPLCTSAGQGIVASSFDNGTIGVWDQAGMLQSQFGHNDAPRTLQIVGNGSMLVGTDSFSLTSWDWQNRKQFRRTQLEHRAFAFACCTHCPYAALWTLGGVELRDYSTGGLVRRIPVGNGYPALAWNPVRREFAVAQRHHVAICDFDGDQVQEFDIGKETVLSLAFSPDGKQLAMGTMSGAIHTKNC